MVAIADPHDAAGKIGARWLGAQRDGQEPDQQASEGQKRKKQT
jgi:hypothetical protein